MKKNEEKFYYDEDRKIKPGLTANKSICYLVESYPKEIQKFAMSFLLNEFAKDEESLAPDLASKCKECGKVITKAVKNGTGLCKSCKIGNPDISGLYSSVEPPPKGPLEEYAKTMYVKDIAEHYGVSDTTVVRWLKKYNIKERIFSHEDRKKVPPKEIFIEDLKIMCMDEIAKKYDISLSILFKWKKRYGLTKEKPSKKDFEKYYGKMTNKALAEKYNIHITTVYNWAIKYGLG